jgi:hypothetical protein
VPCCPPLVDATYSRVANRGIEQIKKIRKSFILSNRD